MEHLIQRLQEEDDSKPMGILDEVEVFNLDKKPDIIGEEEENWTFTMVAEILIGFGILL